MTLEEVYRNMNDEAVYKLGYADGQKSAQARIGAMDQQNKNLQAELAQSRGALEQYAYHQSVIKELREQCDESLDIRGVMRKEIDKLVDIIQLQHNVISNNLGSDYCGCGQVFVCGTCRAKRVLELAAVRRRVAN